MCDRRITLLHNASYDGIETQFYCSESTVPCLKQVIWLNLDKMFLIFVFNLLDTPVFF